MKVKDIMTKNVVHIRPEESVQVAARTLTQYNIGVLPALHDVEVTVGKKTGYLCDQTFAVSGTDKKNSLSGHKLLLLQINNGIIV